MPPKGSMTELVRRVMRDAHVDITDDELAEKIAPYLSGFRYESSAIASWRAGRYRPPAEAVFAVALARGLRLDDYLYGQSYAQKIDALERRLERVLDRLGEVGPEEDAPPRSNA